MIEKEDLKPGDQLPSEREIADKLKVSRSSIREAFSVMESANLIEIYAGKGVFLSNYKDFLINKMNKIIENKGLSLIELIEVREGIEAQSAYLAAIRRTEEDLKEMHRCFQDMKKAYDGNKTGVIEDYYFHLSIAKAAKNTLLTDAIELYANKFMQSVGMLRERSIETGKTSIILEEHNKILTAIIHQDPLAAKEHMSIHLLHAKGRYFKDSKA